MDQRLRNQKLQRQLLKQKIINLGIGKEVLRVRWYEQT